MIPFSILDLSPITEGSDATQSFKNSLDLAQHAEAWGYNRFWLAEHHGMPGIASAATARSIARWLARRMLIWSISSTLAMPRPKRVAASVRRAQGELAGHRRLHVGWQWSAVLRRRAGPASRLRRSGAPRREAPAAGRQSQGAELRPAGA